MARQYYQVMNGLPVGTQLPLDTILVGSSRTRSSSSLVTDSAAGATAFSCVLKTYNGAIGVDQYKKPCGTVLEAAKAVGYHTGLVVTSRITHATPACFAAHVTSREFENDIAIHEIGNYTLGRTVDLMFGGGLCHFRPNSESDSCRLDNADVLQLAKKMGWNVGTDRASFDQLQAGSSSLPVLNLFTIDHMSFEIDRNPLTEPSLKEMAKKALDLLTEATKDSDKGFFLMIEGSRIDMAGHNNDPAAHVREILAYQEAISAVKEYVEAHSENTVMISVSDHETGGLSVARQNTDVYPEYLWHPEALRDVKNSTERIGPIIEGYKGSDKRNFVVNTVLNNWLDIKNASEVDIDYLVTPGRPMWDLVNRLGLLVSKRAQLGWATHGHSAVDVNLYAHGLNAHELAGNHENTDIGAFIVRQLGLDVEAITAKLKSTPMPQSAAAFGATPYRPIHYHHDRIGL
ncbi:vacuolar alkaline phosphatase [Borealophlyctis nickersoniae]|nr:vacuolar alkaline phosphatase [Borealophlyctis nickersoniae]